MFIAFSLKSVGCLPIPPPMVDVKSLVLHDACAFLLLRIVSRVLIKQRYT